MGVCFFGTPEGTRTPNPRNRNPMLYPLSHRRMLVDSLNIIAVFSQFVKGLKWEIFLEIRNVPSDRSGGTFTGDWKEER